MTTRSDVVDHWHAQLDEQERLQRDAGPRTAWMRQVYTRIYRFLISLYGNGEWRAARQVTPGSDYDCMTDVQREQRTRDVAAGMVKVEYGVGGGGGRPKSLGQIRSTLKKVHIANDRETKLGPYQRGLSNEDCIAVAEFHCIKGQPPFGMMLFTRWLDAENIPWRRTAVHGGWDVGSTHGGWQIGVRRVDQEKAELILQRAKEARPSMRLDAILSTAHRQSRYEGPRIRIIRRELRSNNSRAKRVMIGIGIGFIVLHGVALIGVDRLNLAVSLLIAIAVAAGALLAASASRFR